MNPGDDQRLGLAPARIAAHVRAAVALAVRAAPGRMAAYAAGTLVRPKSEAKRS
ncbi:hypothetical protein GCM10009557_93790 [Virgisporangium ochraceum]